jgi:hypothetical protein
MILPMPSSHFSPEDEGRQKTAWHNNLDDHVWMFWFKKCIEFVDQLSDYHIIKKDPAVLELMCIFVAFIPAQSLKYYIAMCIS